MTGELDGGLPPDGRWMGEPTWKRGDKVKIEHDGFVGTLLDPYTTLEGKKGWTAQLEGARVVHVYGEKWLTRV